MGGAANVDEIIRQQCIAREDTERRERTLERNYKLAQETIAEMSSTLAEKDSAMNKMKLEIGVGYIFFKQKSVKLFL